MKCEKKVLLYRHLKIYILLVYIMFLSMLTNIKIRPEINHSKNTLAYYEMREKSFIVQDPPCFPIEMRN